MKKIFVIDDDVYIGDMLEEILTKEGYSVSVHIRVRKRLCYFRAINPISFFLT